MQNIDSISGAAAATITRKPKLASSPADAGVESRQPAAQEAATATVVETQTQRAEQPPEQPAPSNELVEQALEAVRAQAQRTAPQLRFEPDTERDLVVIKVIDRATGEVIRQLPPESVVEAAAGGREALPTLIADIA